MPKPKSPCILYVATFPPRECGIATFTQDLTNAFDKEFNPGVRSKILAINANGTSIYNYPRKVAMQINETDIEDYLNRANEINRSPNIKLVNIQHEYGIFGGDWGNYLLPFLELLKKPVVNTFHTVLPHPKEFVKKITRAICEKSSGVVVMTKSAARLLENAYGVKKSKIFVIPHGVHHIPFPSKSRAKKKLNLSGRTVLATFGMLNRDKGIEYAIAALPEIVKEFPDVLYLIIGATHPNIVRQEGEVYRNKLKRTIIKNGLKDYVKFYNKYLDLPELIEYLKATDIYISPTLNPKQAVSGTVSYALSCACPIISTANQYARDVINAERGILVKFRNSSDIKKALFELLRDKQARREMKKNTYFYSRHMTWQNVALSYFKTFNNFAKIVPREKDKLPAINLDHIKTLTNKFGMIQFAAHTKPDPHSGYCLDDNARAMLACAIYYKDKPLKSILDLINKYLKFVKHAQKTNGKFINFINYNRKFTEGESEDSFGRAIWSLGYVISSAHLPENIKKKAKIIFNKAVKWAPDLKSPRAIAFTILGLSYIAEDGADKIALIKKLADKLARRYRATVKKDGKWQWFEDYLTYSNFKLSESLMRAYQTTKNKEYLRVAEDTFKFLLGITFEKRDYFSPIGQDGWYFRDGKRAYFDQQPEDTASAAESLITAYQVTKKKIYLHKARLAFEWFLGKNHLNQMIYDEATGGCYDGLGKYSINFNQGAESTISYLLARLAMEKVK
ncbi:glycosyltransferase [Candidatus Parcubacteria bacterium]|nr:glycosyltransferase [Candidatus Parcubacteria bacterium]